MISSVDVYVTWIEPLTTFFHVLILGVATGGISLFLTKSTLLNGFHDWLAHHALPVEHVLECTWCTSHWVGAVLLLIYQPFLLGSDWRPAWLAASRLNYLLIPVDFIVTLMVIVAVAVVIARTVYSAVKSLNV
jgi:hypothetical protein